MGYGMVIAQEITEFAVHHIQLQEKGEERKMKKLKMLAVLVALALMFTGVGQAEASLFDFSFVGNNVSGSGRLVASEYSSGNFIVESGIGQINGEEMNLIANPNAPGSTNTAVFYVAGYGNFYITYDDMLFPEQNPVVSNAGLLFSSASFPYINIFSEGADQYLYFPSSTLTTSVSFTLTAVPDPATMSVVPEPATMLLLGVGLLGAAGFRRKFNYIG